MLTATPSPAPPRAMGVNLVLFFAFALCALVLLTRTLVSVTQAQAGIRDSVQPATGRIVNNTALLHQLARTNQVAAHVRIAGDGVNASLTDVASATRQLVTQFGDVRDGTGRIDRSVAGIAASSADVQRIVLSLETNVAFTDRSAAQISSSFVGSDTAVRTVPTSLSNALADLYAVLAVIPRISQQAAAISVPLAGVDRHLANVYANGLVQLANLLPLYNLLPRAGAGGGR